jgi:hypothetical protein
MRHGLVAKCTLGSLFLIRDTKDDSSGRRGRSEFAVISRGPGTKTKCVSRVIIGYDAMRSAKPSKFSTTHVTA